MTNKPNTKPNNPNFSSGPCSKRPGWDITVLKNALTGRSHRSKPGKERLLEVIEKTRNVLGIPAEYKIGIVPASDTGAVEMALWTMLGARGVDVFAWESFSSGWAADIEKHLKITDLNIYEADYGKLPDLSKTDPARDTVFAWNGTTSGVKVPNANWIAGNREGLTICDATSAVFAMDLDWSKLDVTTWSWQKVMGGEGQHGMLVLSPRAVQRLESFTPDRALPKIFRLTKKGKLIEGIFKGETINTPSMLCVEDHLDALNWAEGIGGLKTLIQRSSDNLNVITEWVNKTDWVDFLAESQEINSNTSICLKISDPWYNSLSADEQQAKAKEITKLLDQENVAYDIGAYRDAPAGIRIWGGATVEKQDLEALTPWLDWAFSEIKNKAEAA